MSLQVEVLENSKSRTVFTDTCSVNGRGRRSNCYKRSTLKEKDVTWPFVKLKPNNFVQANLAFFQMLNSLFCTCQLPMHKSFTLYDESHLQGKESGVEK